MFLKPLSVFAGCVLSLSLLACQVPAGVGPANQPSTPLAQELNEAASINLESARNSVNQARNVYFNVSGQLLQVGALDVGAFQAVRNDVLPSMLAAANSLTVITESAEPVVQLKTEYQSLFSDIVTQMLNGINNNLRIYQNFIESPQSLDGTGVTTPNQVFVELALLFQATELTEQFAAQLAQFQGLLNNATDVLGGIRSQQSVVINGVLRTAGGIEDQATLQQGYLTLVQSLTRSELLGQLAQLARQAYGEQNVALNQSELTPTQSNPNLLQMVVRESDSNYRVIRIEDGRLINELRSDSRGLSAADLLNQSNVVVVREAPSP